LRGWGRAELGNVPYSYSFVIFKKNSILSSIFAAFQFYDTEWRIRVQNSFAAALRPNPQTGFRGEGRDGERRDRLAHFLVASAAYVVASTFAFPATDKTTQGRLMQNCNVKNLHTKDLTTSLHLTLLRGVISSRNAFPPTQFR